MNRLVALLSTHRIRQILAASNIDLTHMHRLVEWIAANKAKMSAKAAYPLFEVEFGKDFLKETTFFMLWSNVAPWQEEIHDAASYTTQVKSYDPHDVWDTANVSAPTGKALSLELATKVNEFMKERERSGQPRLVGDAWDVYGKEIEAEGISYNDFLVRYYKTNEDGLFSALNLEGTKETPAAPVKTVTPPPKVDRKGTPKRKQLEPMMAELKEDGLTAGEAWNIMKTTYRADKAFSFDSFCKAWETVKKPPPKSVYPSGKTWTSPYTPSTTPVQALPPASDKWSMQQVILFILKDKKTHHTTAAADWDERDAYWDLIDAANKTDKGTPVGFLDFKKLYELSSEQLQEKLRELNLKQPSPLGKPNASLRAFLHMVAYVREGPMATGGAAQVGWDYMTEKMNVKPPIARKEFDKYWQMPIAELRETANQSPALDEGRDAESKVETIGKPSVPPNTMKASGLMDGKSLKVYDEVYWYMPRDSEEPKGEFSLVSPEVWRIISVMKGLGDAPRLMMQSAHQTQTLDVQTSKFLLAGTVAMLAAPVGKESKPTAEKPRTPQEWFVEKKKTYMLQKETASTLSVGDRFFLAAADGGLILDIVTMEPEIMVVTSVRFPKGNKGENDGIRDVDVKVESEPNRSFRTFYVTPDVEVAVWKIVGKAKGERFPDAAPIEETKETTKAKDKAPVMKSGKGRDWPSQWVWQMQMLHKRGWNPDQVWREYGKALQEGGCSKDDVVFDWDKLFKPFVPNPVLTDYDTLDDVWKRGYCTTLLEYYLLEGMAWRGLWYRLHYEVGDVPLRFKDFSETWKQEQLKSRKKDFAGEAPSRTHMRQEPTNRTLAEQIVHEVTNGDTASARVLWARYHIRYGDLPMDYKQFVQMFNMAVQEKQESEKGKGL